MAHLQNARSTTPMRSLPSALLSAGGLALLLALLGVMLRPVALTPGQVIGALVVPDADPTVTAIVRNVRLPRVLLAALAGSLLGVAALLLGQLAQRGVRDPGWSGMAALGALAGVVALMQTPAAPPWAISLVTLAGCSLGVALLVVVQRRRLSAWVGLAIALLAPIRQPRTTRLDDLAGGSAGGAAYAAPDRAPSYATANSALALGGSKRGDGNRDTGRRRAGVGGLACRYRGLCAARTAAEDDLWVPLCSARHYCSAPISLPAASHCCSRHWDSSANYPSVRS